MTRWGVCHDGMVVCEGTEQFCRTFVELTPLLDAGDGVVMPCTVVQVLDDGTVREA